MNNHKGKKQEFIRSLSVHPSTCILVHMLACPLLEALELVLQVSSDTVVLHYDTVFNIGDYYLSTLLFCDSMLKKTPIVPFGYFIHSQCFKENHLNFLKSIFDNYHLFYLPKRLLL